MTINKTEQVPMIFSGSGACLTPKNWEDAGITTISCSLQELLFKPGIDLLYQIKDLAKYIGWRGKLILNAQMPTASRDGSYWLFSPYDGSKLHVLPETITALVEHLQPDHVILPYELQKHKDLEKSYTESNKPSQDACEGFIYTRQGNIDITDSDMAMQFEPLDSECACETCKQFFTRAYLHHLLANTPLLAQRLLIMHNVYWISTYKKI